MKTFVLIGGIGSGKSTVCKMLDAHDDVQILSLDAVGHEALGYDEVQSVLIDEFGSDLVEDGVVNRKLLASRAFGDSASTIRLNNAVHPKLHQLTLEKLEHMRKAGSDKVIIEISAFDGPEGRWGDLVRNAEMLIAVTAPMRQRLERATAKGFDEEDVRNRIEQQASDTQRLIWAGYTIDNSADLEDLQAQADNLWEAMQD